LNTPTNARIRHGQGSNQRLGSAGQRSREGSRWKDPSDKKLEAEGKTDKAVGKMQNAIGGFKDTLRGK
jgi:hypothetical protein